MLARIWSEVMDFVQLECASKSGHIWGLSMDGGLWRCSLVGQNCGLWSWGIAVGISQGSEKSANLVLCRSYMPWAQLEHDSVSLQYQALISAKGSFDTDLMWIRNALKKADSKSSGKITGALRGVQVWFAVRLWGWHVWAALYWRGHEMLPRLPSSEV